LRTGRWRSPSRAFRAWWTFRASAAHQGIPDRLDPEKLVAYGLSISQVEQQIANNNTNGGGSFIEQGAQQINVQSLGLFTSVQDIENTVVKNSERRGHQDQDIATVVAGPKIRLGQIGRAIHIKDGKKVYDDGRIVDNPDTVEGHRSAAERRRLRPCAARHPRRSRQAEPRHSAQGREGQFPSSTAPTW
jgi:hypothetical protein